MVMAVVSALLSVVGLAVVVTLSSATETQTFHNYTVVVCFKRPIHINRVGRKVGLY